MTETTTTPEQKSAAFAARLKSAREAMGLECKDVAGQLHLQEKFIVMMERNEYAPDLPAMFIRGYLRAYAKLMQFSDDEVKTAVEPFASKPSRLA